MPGPVPDGKPDKGPEELRASDVPRGMDHDDCKPAAMEPRGSIDDTIASDQDAAQARQHRREAEAPKTAADLSMGKHARIVDHLLDMPEPMDVYLRIRSGLTFGSRASSLGYGELVEALDAAEELAAEAARLAANMKVALAAFLIDAMVIRSALRKQVNVELKNQKDAGKLAKATISNDDIDAMMADMFNDEYRDLELRISKAKRSTEAVEALDAIARERARDLRAMVSKSRDA